MSQSVSDALIESLTSNITSLSDTFVFFLSTAEIIRRSSLLCLILISFERTHTFPFLWKHRHDMSPSTTHFLFLFSILILRYLQHKPDGLVPPFHCFGLVWSLSFKKSKVNEALHNLSLADFVTIFLTS